MNKKKKPTKTGSIQGSFGDPDGIFEDPTTDEASPHHRHFGLQKRQQIPQRPLNIKNIFHSPKSPTANKSEEAVTADTLTLTLTLTHTRTQIKERRHDSIKPAAAILFVLSVCFFFLLLFLEQQNQTFQFGGRLQAARHNLQLKKKRKKNVEHRNVKIETMRRGFTLAPFKVAVMFDFGGAQSRDQIWSGCFCLK